MRSLASIRSTKATLSQADEHALMASTTLALDTPVADRGPLQDALTLLLAFLALLAWDLGGLDLPLVRWYGSTTGFVWRDQWLTGGVMHEGVRAAAWVVFGLLVVSIWRPLPFARLLTRRERIWWVVTTLACVALIPLLKRASWTSCPWSLIEFGSGTARYVSHWAFGVRDGGPGGCFPSGHASSAFSFLTGWFVLRRRAPLAARIWLAVTLAAGLLFGWVQMMRGAHYLSHSLWTAWVCWAVAALSFHGLRRWREAGASPA